MRKVLSFLTFSGLFILLSIHTVSFSTARGIKVNSKQGKSIYLYQDYQALVVGISDYEKWPKLANAVNDAKEVAARLKDMGLDVRLLLDPESRVMKTALSKMVYEMGKERNRAILLYYAGHGETEILADKTKMGYIIPKDCPLLNKDPVGFAAHAISMRDIESVSLRIRSKHVLMLFDSCFSGSLFALVRAVPDDISEKSALPVRQYITAGREDEQVPDRSIFKRCFLIGLEGDADLTGDGYITGSELGMYLSDKVVNYTHRRQHPQYGKINNPDLDRGDFVLVPRKVQLEELAEERRMLEAERSVIAEELRRLRVERTKSEELVREMKRLLEAKWQAEEREKQILAEKKKSEGKIKQRQEGEQIDMDGVYGRLKDLESKLHAAEEKMRKEAHEKKVLEAKLKRVESKRQKSAEPVKIRAVPTEDITESELKQLITRYNFYDKVLNDRGEFHNEFIDNGDGTISDRITGLMWEKAGSSSEIVYWRARKYVSRLNKRDFAGHEDWRIPTLGELCSLLESSVNERGRHIDPIFSTTQSVYWTTDSFFGTSLTPDKQFVVDFAEGRIDRASQNLRHMAAHTVFPDPCSVRAVRTIK